MRLFIKLVIAGLLSAIVLGGFLKIVEQITGETVYVLLLNVDYFPIIKDWEMSEMIEFLLHVMVSIMLVMILYLGFRKWDLHGKIYPYIVSNVIIGAVLFLTTVLSNRTPNITDMSAFLYWMVGHLIYGAVVGCLLILKEDKWYG